MGCNMNELSRIEKSIYQELGIKFSHIPKLQISYGYDNNTHIIKISPSEIYDTSFEYINAEIEFEEWFTAKYNQDILFISENSLTKLNDIIFNIKI